MPWGIVIVYGGIGVVVVLLSVVTYLFAVSSRKRYRCPSCGERIRTEYLDAAHCNMCGAPLQQEM